MRRTASRESFIPSVPRGSARERPPTLGLRPALAPRPPAPDPPALPRTPTSSCACISYRYSPVVGRPLDRGDENGDEQEVDPNLAPNADMKACHFTGRL